MGKIKPKLLIINERAPLVDVRAEYFPQRCVKQMRGRVMPCGGGSPGCFNIRITLKTDLERPFLDHDPVEMCLAGFDRIQDPDLHAVCRDHTGITYLPPTLCVKGGRVEHHISFIANIERLLGGTFFKQRHNFRLL